MTRVAVEVSPGRTVAIDDGVLDPYRARLAELPDAPPARLAYAATRIVLRDDYRDAPHTLDAPGTPTAIADAIDWETTAALRRRLDDLGFGVAEAMDTAQRFAIGWHTAEQLIRRTGALGLRNGFVAGAGADHLEAVTKPEDLAAAVVHQGKVIQEVGGEVILLPLPWLSLQGCDADTYVAVYSEVIRALDGPLYLHWLGAMFLPALAGYFPGDSFARIMALDPAKVRGAKLSLLDADLELRLRAELLPRDQFILTGDDFHFADLILGGDGTGVPPTQRHVGAGSRRVPVGEFSHALLGILDGVAEPASLALEFLARGDARTYLEVMRPCEELGRWLFQEPTQHYKAGLAFLSWLNGLQSNAMLANHEERARDREHYVRAVELASAAGALQDAALAAERLSREGP